MSIPIELNKEEAYAYQQWARDLVSKRAIETKEQYAK